MSVIPNSAVATVIRYNYPPQFGTKILVPPLAPAALFIPTTAGPNYEGRLSGALLTPAIVQGVVDEDGSVRDIAVASVKFTLSASDISTQVSVGVLPYKEG